MNGWRRGSIAVGGCGFEVAALHQAAEVGGVVASGVDLRLEEGCRGFVGDGDPPLDFLLDAEDVDFGEIGDLLVAEAGEGVLFREELRVNGVEAVVERGISAVPIAHAVAAATLSPIAALVASAIAQAHGFGDAVASGPPFFEAFFGEGFDKGAAELVEVADGTIDFAFEGFEVRHDFGLVLIEDGGGALAHDGAGAVEEGRDVECGNDGGEIVGGDDFGLRFRLRVVLGDGFGFGIRLRLDLDDFRFRLRDGGGGWGFAFLGGRGGCGLW